MYINRRLLRCWSARGSVNGFSRVSPTKVKTCKSFLLTFLLLSGVMV